jgi:hypothetical protein
MHVYEIIRWILALLFGFFGWLLIFVNFKIVYVWLVRREHHSWIPLVGGLFAFAGMGLCPLRPIQKFAWIPAAIDLGYCVSVLMIGLLMQLNTWRLRNKKGNG